MKIGIVGAGRLGSAFGLYATRRGAEEVGYYSRTQASTVAAASLVGDVGRVYTDVASLIRESDWIVLTVPDDEIPEVVQKLAEEGDVEGKLVFHMSGAASSEVLLPMKQIGAHTASLHPLQSFADGCSGADKLETTVFGIEGEVAAVSVLEEWLTAAKNRYFIITATQKPLYHAAAAVVSNGLTGVVDFALHLMAAAGIEEKTALSALLPLIEGTVQNIQEKGVAEALTGPIARGDIGTIVRHTEAIAGQAPQLLENYQMLGRLTLATACQSQLRDPKRIARLQELLSE
ncbi:putative short-subunit dehydrogenase-like oxidoreductase (DUF2520 family) [Aneurinibacillus soli]|uniref:2-dehydropantoate 2-reductase n=2 Tax=Aneurinibacillus soli TaxID=1500254 RepID=A0A0U5BEQ9_9BACL|nr:Rossmann-like and DUF2520 domain-containing protein [Aneurinibacillus soli]PYE59489.1 putative short-subunit dehydrogenase-like oxidoreductase (DUF2520 family) [Aneurinibacillus soli]BAU29181.1 2-dehydropantoate 2-reductase [Aneurinibacillus soli]